MTPITLSRPIEALLQNNRNCLMTLNESNTVEEMVIDAAVSNGWTDAAGSSLSRHAIVVLSKRSQELREERCDAHRRGQD